MTAQSVLAARANVRRLGSAVKASPKAFQVVMVSPEGYVHSAALTEVAESVLFGLQALGVQATMAVNQLVAPGPPAIMFGAHLLSAQEAELLPDSTVIYNLEQIGAAHSWCSPAYLSLLRRCHVWDYSIRNIAALRHIGVQRVTHVPVGYVKQLSRIPGTSVQDIDVLFYGSINERRSNAISALQARGLNAQAVFGVYGAARDALIARAKVVLNLHYYETSIFELVRVSYLLANHKAVVAECHAETEIDPDIEDAVRLATYEELTDACVELVTDDAARRSLQHRAFAVISARSESTYLATALGLPSPLAAGGPLPAGGTAQ